MKRIKKIFKDRRDILFLLVISYALSGLLDLDFSKGLRLYIVLQYSHILFLSTYAFIRYGK